MGSFTQKQMDVFDFIEKPPEHKTHENNPESKTLLQRLFVRLNNPVIRCRNCLCSYCANNAEELYRKVNPKEMQECCFNCDECYEYDGNCGRGRKIKEDCEKFVISDYGAGIIRKKFKVMEG